MFDFVSPERVGISSEHVLKFIQTLDEYNFCTHSFIMARGKHIFAEGYYAPFTKDFKHRMYSVSKSFVGVAVGLAVEDGLLNLEDKFVKFFPDYLNENSNNLLKDMTIRDMLTMETSQAKQVRWFTSDTVDRCEVYFRTAAKRVSGTTWKYDSHGSFMLGVIVEKLTGKPLLEYLKERFLLQGGFSKDAYCLQCPGGYSFGDSGIMCTTRDLLIFARFVMDGGVIDKVRYMNEEFLLEATKKQVSNSHGGEIAYNTHGYGYQIWKAPNDGFAFVGMGDQFAICDREKDFIFIINSDNQGKSPITRTILYQELYNTIVKNLGEPLTENEKAVTELKAYIDNLKLFCLKESTKSPFAEELNGRTYILEENPMGIDYVHFELKGDKGEMTYKNAQGVKKLPFGFGHNEFCKFPQENYSDIIANIPVEGHMYDCAVSADWPEERKLRIKVQIIDKYMGNMSMEFGFKDDKVGVYMEKNAEAFLEEYCGYANGVLQT
ncbi:MAG: serine hydrolase [Lachnospiraceae bacterium]|nr:serine hydrolase [Lachnospiraceae bacterium]